MLEGAWLYVWLAVAALAAGAVNSIAGGGTLLTFPALNAVVPAVVANGSSTVALVPASISAAWGFRENMAATRGTMRLLVPPSILGGLIGSLLVALLDPQYFDALVPWLVLSAAMLFAVQPLLTRHIALGKMEQPGTAIIIAVVTAQFLVAIYGGYFGAGIGILMLSALGLMGIGDIHAMNGLKNFLAVCINGVSVLIFVVTGLVHWRYVAVMAPAAIVGAYAGARVAQRINRLVVRGIVIVIGFGLAGHYFYQRWNT